MKTLTAQHQNVYDIKSFLFFMTLSSILVLTNSIQLLIAFFPFVFMRNWKDKSAFILPTFYLYFISPQLMIQLLIYSVGFTMFSYFVKMCRGDVLKFNQFYVALCSASIAYFSSNESTVALTFFVIQMIYYHETMKSFEWLKKELSFPPSLYALCVISIFVLLVQILPEYTPSFMVIALIFICFGCSPLISITSFFMMNILTQGMFGFELFVYIYLLSLLRKQLGLMLLVYAGLFISQVNDLSQMFMVVVYLIFLLLLSKEGLPIQNDQIKQSNSKIYLHNQLMHFSMIFDHLGTYYENVSSIESSFLKSMAKALHYTSKKTQDEKSIDSIKNKVISILEGYDIGYEDVFVEENEEGFIRIECSLVHFQMSEVKEVLLPLLDHILPTPVECISCNASLRQLGILNVEFISTPPIQIDAYADSVTNQTTCGDSFSIFHHSRNVYCLISDGMGSGSEASKISKCIVHLFQRMIFSNIDEIEAMNCMNKLLLSDAYATCDVLSFDRYRKSVVICKSAANPTYLIRNSELFAIWGNSLPIGIVAHIDVDHIHVEVEKGDWFVMSSDGVNVEEILTWMKESENLNARKEVERFMKLMKNKERSDDSTILLAKVQ